MSAEVIRLNQKAAHYRRHMWTDVIFASFLVILACVYAWLDVNTWIIAAMTTSSAVLIGRASVWRSARRDLLRLARHLNNNRAWPT